VDPNMYQEDAVYMKAARQAAKRSPDPSRKTGCVLVLPNGEVRACNDFPTGVVLTAERLERPLKYSFMEHAERNAIYWCAAQGYRTAHSTMYLPWFPCADCARAIVQSGISRLVAIEPEWTEERYGFNESRAILSEGGVKVDFYCDISKGGECGS
jgi:dCMP deaminase